MAAQRSSPAMHLDCKKRGPPGCGNAGENSPLLPARTTSIARPGYFRPPNGPSRSAGRQAGAADQPRRIEAPQKGIVVDALGAFKDVPQIGMIMAKPDWDAVTVSAEAPAVVVTVGVRLAPYRKGAASCFSAADR
ncbi:hypothetical protein ACVIHF_001898 [Bradyrhizobium sp. USDA 4506]